MNANAPVDGTLSSGDGVLLAYRTWQPAYARAAVLIVHGLGEHSGRYDHVARHLVGRQIACYAFDCRGHGHSEGPRVHVERFDEYLEDVTVARAHVRSLRPGLPLFLLGHSQGGLIVLLSALMSPTGLAGVAVSSPFLGIHPTSRPSAALAAAARVLSRSLPTVRFDNGIDTALLSHDPAVVKAYDADPLVTRKVSARWYTELLAAQERVLGLAPMLEVPALVMQSGADELVDPAATRRWAEAAPRRLAEYVEWEGLYHEMLNELDKPKVLARLVAWMDARLPA